MAEQNGDAKTTIETIETSQTEIPPTSLPNGTNQHIEKHAHNHDHDHDHTHNHNDDPNAGALFQITVKLPHEPYQMPLMVTSQEQVQDVRQSIIETSGTFQYTCFHLEHNGERINDYVELSEVKGLKPDSELVLLEDPYTEKDARMHVIRIRELVGVAGDRADQLHGICAGMSLHDAIIASDTTTNGTTDDAVPEEHPLVHYSFDDPASISTILPPKHEVLPKTLKCIAVSPWNPPPYHLRQRGHLLYLQVTTNEGEQHQITASVSGFFVNKCSNNKFDPCPRPAPKNYRAHSLLSLISLLSPSFNAAFKELQDANNKKDLLTLSLFRMQFLLTHGLYHRFRAITTSTTLMRHELKKHFSCLD